VYFNLKGMSNFLLQISNLPEGKEIDGKENSGYYLTTVKESYSVFSKKELLTLSGKKIGRKNWRKSMTN
jgi:hypothetical protein